MSTTQLKNGTKLAKYAYRQGLPPPLTRELRNLMTNEDEMYDFRSRSIRTCHLTVNLEPILWARWIVDGLSMICRWIVNDWSMDCRWPVDYLSMDCRWALYRCSLDIRWMFVGLSIHALCMCVGFPIDFSWAFDRRLLEVRYWLLNWLQMAELLMRWVAVCTTDWSIARMGFVFWTIWESRFIFCA